MIGVGASAAQAAATIGLFFVGFLIVFGIYFLILFVIGLVVSKIPRSIGIALAVVLIVVGIALLAPELDVIGLFMAVFLYLGRNRRLSSGISLKG